MSSSEEGLNEEILKKESEENNNNNIDIDINNQQSEKIDFPKDLFKKIKNLNFSKEEITKLIISLFFIIIIILLNSSIFSYTSLSSKCYYDLGFKLTKNLNISVKNNIWLYKCLVMSGQIIMDIIFFYGFYRWAIYGITWRYGVTVMFFYFIRGVVQECLKMRIPYENIWINPGIISVSVNYVRGNDFFFSGHVGMCAVAWAEIKKERNYFMTYFCLFATFFESFILLITRDHYTFDMPIGFMFGHYITFFVEDWVNYLQLKIPFMKKWMFNNIDDYVRMYGYKFLPEKKEIVDAYLKEKNINKSNFIEIL